MTQSAANQVRALRRQLVDLHARTETAETEAANLTAKLTVIAERDAEHPWWTDHPWFTDILPAARRTRQAEAEARYWRRLAHHSLDLARQAVDHLGAA